MTPNYLEITMLLTFQMLGRTRNHDKSSQNIVRPPFKSGMVSCETLSNDKGRQFQPLLKSFKKSVFTALLDTICDTDTEHVFNCVCENTT